ncbi:MAG TPA: type II toxin-antitoxin system RelE/ParE family toxin [Coleofasciculaceae cyanobacterium]|jgi:mRNA-degrading endonuclease RelE of RelBE toxin-antitoxin system
MSAVLQQASGQVVSTPWSVFLTRTADKSQRKLDKPLRILLRDALLDICQDPERQGERLSQPLTSVYSHHITYKGKEFRIAYQLVPETECVVVVLIGPHENFYRKLKNLLYAS